MLRRACSGEIIFGALTDTAAAALRFSTASGDWSPCSALRMDWLKRQFASSYAWRADAGMFVNVCWRRFARMKFVSIISIRSRVKKKGTG
jgi:hypothetical protein